MDHSGLEAGVGGEGAPPPEGVELLGLGLFALRRRELRELLPINLPKLRQNLSILFGK